MTVQNERPNFNHERDEMLGTFDELHSQAVEKMQEIVDEATRLQNSPVISELDYIRVHQRGNQLYELSQLVIGVAERYEYAQSPVRVHIDSPDFSLTDTPETLIPERLLPVDKTDLYEHNNLGVREGTDIFLALLVPDEITDPGIRAIYFSRWRLDLLQKISKDLVADDDGAIHFFQPTRLSNVVVHYYYAPTTNLPRRTLCINEGVSFEPTPPS